MELRGFEGGCVHPPGEHARENIPTGRVQHSLLVAMRMMRGTREVERGGAQRGRESSAAVVASRSNVYSVHTLKTTSSGLQHQQQEITDTLHKKLCTAARFPRTSHLLFEPTVRFDTSPYTQFSLGQRAQEGGIGEREGSVHRGEKFATRKMRMFRVCVLRRSGDCFPRRGRPSCFVFSEPSELGTTRKSFLLAVPVSSIIHHIHHH